MVSVFYEVFPPVTNFLVPMGIQALITRAIAYLGKSVLPISPKQAADFSLVSLFSEYGGRKLSKALSDASYYKTARTVAVAAKYLPATLAVAFNILSPLQAITALALHAISSDIYQYGKYLIR